MSFLNLATLLTGIALFLYGMTLMGDGLKKVAGNKLEVVLYKLTSNKGKAILLGAGVAAVIQSSAATSIMVMGFVNSGMMQFLQAAPIILGSILGTSITDWIICLSSLETTGGWVDIFSTTVITMIFALIGIYLARFSPKQQHHSIGSILMGFAVLMFGMSTMSGAIKPLCEEPGFLKFFMSFENPILGIVAGALFAALLQSSAAAVGILQAVSMTGAVTFGICYPLILGMAIGGALPVIVGAIGANTDAKRTALVHLLIDILGAVFGSVVFYGLNGIIDFGITNQVLNPVSIAAINTLFRVVVILVAAPIVGLIEKLACAIIKTSAEDEEITCDVDRLEERFLAHPALAIEQTRIVINSMAKASKDALDNAIMIVENFNEQTLEKVKELEALVDRYEDNLGSYIIKITAKELNPEQNENVYKYLHSITDFERISDHALNIAECAEDIKNKNVHFSPQAQKELSVIKAAVTEIIGLAMTAFEYEDIEKAYLVEPLEERIDELTTTMKHNHTDRLAQGICTLEQGFVFNDIIMNYERIADHCSNIAVGMIETKDDSYDTHKYIDNLKEIKAHNFDEQFAKYSEKYQF